MSLKLNSSGGGSVTLQEPATASALTLNLPAVNGTVVSTGDTGSVTVSMISATGTPSSSTYLRGDGTWSAATPTTYAIEYLVIGGGGAGGSNTSGPAGGGGAGGYRTNVTGATSGGGASAEGAFSVQVALAYPVFVGAGGAPGTDGQQSAFGPIVSVGGGRGGGIPTANLTGAAGGSGGGGGSIENNTTYNGGSGTTGQGYAGGQGRWQAGQYAAGGGGGGAGAVGGNFGTGSSGIGGAGGAGVSSSITGSAVTRAGGGGGAGNTNAAGGSGGGGQGMSNTANTQAAGTVNTGSGGGGGNGALGAPGGSGIVIIRYSGSQRGTGGTVTSSGGFTIHTFTTSGTYTA